MKRYIGLLLMAFCAGLFFPQYNENPQGVSNLKFVKHAQAQEIEQTSERKRIRDYGIIIGTMQPGKRNSITDVEGIKVGHVTLNDGPIKTGVTAILPHSGNTFKEKVLAADVVLNGFGKTVGTIQIDEMGTIETPIVLTNTLSVGIASDAVVKYMLSQNEDIGVKTGTVNPVVAECNDSYLNDIRGGHVKTEHVLEAINNASIDVKEGSVGAGTGMSCYGLKGGIGTASRIVKIGDKQYTVGVLVLSNFGTQEDLTINGYNIGAKIAQIQKTPKIPEKGSIIITVATDIPLSERQLKRVAKRASVGLIRTGSYLGNGSGDIVLAFSTGNKIKHYSEPIITIDTISDGKISDIFRAVAEATEEAILNVLVTADTTVGKDGHKRVSLRDYMYLIQDKQ